MRRAAVAALCAALLGGCGDGEAGGEAPALTVAAASSLKTAFERYGETFGDVRFSFAGSDELAAQIEQGVKPDVYAAASTTLPDDLFEQGLVEEPVVFARNRLVLAVPAGPGGIATLADAAGGGVDLAIGSAAVPIGAYTRRVLDALPARERERILGNVRSEEPDAAGIVGKLTQGAVDAGFVYASDVRATGDELEAIELPDALQPSVAYGAAVVTGAEHPEAARRFVAGLRSATGERALEAAGFEPPP
jgi:molybdate transport system substrate-binding protein